MLQPPCTHGNRGLLNERLSMNESEFESALDSVFDSDTDDRYWVELFCGGDRFVSTIYSEVVRTCAIQYGANYTEKWRAMSLLLREMYVAMGGVDNKDCDIAEDGLRLIRNALRSPALFRDTLGRCSVLPAFANLLYYAMRMNRTVSVLCSFRTALIMERQTACCSTGRIIWSRTCLSCPLW